MTCIINFPQTAAEQIDYMDGGCVPSFVGPDAAGPMRRNPGAWGIGAYDVVKSLTVTSDRAGMTARLVREVCEVTVHRPGTMHEAIAFRITRHTTAHAVDAEAFPIALEEVERLKQQLVSTTVSVVETRAISIGSEMPVYY